MRVRLKKLNKHKMKKYISKHNVRNTVTLITEHTEQLWNTTKISFQTTQLPISVYKLFNNQANDTTNEYVQYV